MPDTDLAGIPYPEIDWTVAPDPHEIEQLRDVAALSLWEKLGWLEEAQRYVEHMKAQREARGLKN